MATVADDIIADYTRCTPTSRDSYDRARRSLVNGTTGNLRHFDPYPLYFESGDGVRLTDVDGREYIDCFLGNGPMFLGHNHPEVMASIHQHLRAGLLVVNPRLAFEVAERVVETVPWAERVRFLNSGTEAVVIAVRCARAHTGRSTVVKFFGHYHGQSDQLLVGVGARRETMGAGISADTVSETITVAYPDRAALETTLREHDVAAVILDPAMHVGGLWGSSHDHLVAVRDICRCHGTLLIFDEVITGFRLAPGGAAEFYSVTPDLAVFAKALSAGEKLSAVVGRADVMGVIAPDPTGRRAHVFQSGTTNDGTVALAAAAAAIDVYRDVDSRGGYQDVERCARRLASGLTALFADHGMSLRINTIASMMQLFVTDASPEFEVFASLDTQVVELFYLAMIGEGVLLSLPGSNHIYLSLLHRDSHIDTVLQAAARVLDRYDFSALIPSMIATD